MSVLQRYIDANGKFMDWLAEQEPDGRIPAPIIDEMVESREALIAYWNGPEPISAEDRGGPLLLRERLALRKLGDCPSWLEAIGQIVALSYPTEGSDLECAVVLFPRSPSDVGMTPYEARQAALALLTAANYAEYGEGLEQQHNENMRRLGAQLIGRPADEADPG